MAFPLILMPLALLVPSDPRALIEGHMSLHMLVEFPLLYASGWSAARRWPGATQCISRFDVLGLASASWTAAIAAFWMLPVTLDLALLDGRMALAKYITWWSAGLLQASGWSRLTLELRVLFLGNAAWMLATAGLLYQDAPTRLCVNYRFDEQAWTGTGLLVWAVMLAGIAIAQTLHPCSEGEDA